MGWGEAGKPGGGRPARPDDDWNRAIALCAGQVPELFVLFGDPDAGDLLILTRD
ncbi:hypothetical protein [Streptomyces tendae]|uniref:hypothetical protein n=1 Tax=Streptomyces tendae TaxID=1932 RepID=UPI002491C670|nr:hypothetical protein [Streptomyces tendae]